MISIICSASACARTPNRDTASPVIQDITTSSKVLAKSDCIPTTLTVTASIKDDKQVAEAEIWYRIGSDQEFSPTRMKHVDGDEYTVALVALDIPGGEYGVLEFYIIARDATGNETKSALDSSVELLPCVAA